MVRRFIMADAARDPHEAAQADRLRQLFAAAVAAVQPGRCLPPALAASDAARATGRLRVIALGKAGTGLMQVACDTLSRPFEGLLITPSGQSLANPPPWVRQLVGGHPVPDAGSVEAGREALAFVSALGPGDHLLALVSGGGSALMCAPPPGVSLVEKQALTRDLLRSGAAISEINCVRKHLSRVKGGRLAMAAFPATVETLAISDVPGDQPLLIASGPTLADTSTLAQARAVLARYGLDPAPSIRAALSDPANETLKPDHPQAARLSVQIIARAADALDAAAAVAVGSGLAVQRLGDQLEGEARDLGTAHAALALGMQPGDRPALLLSGGETTVTIRHPGGRGGPNLEYLLAMAVALGGAPGISAIACDTDGQDGTEPVAGAVITPTTLSRARALRIDAADHLARHDSHGFFAALGDLVPTGPTGTNVNDFRAILIDRSGNSRG
jgi:glycerate 2-kinase